MNAFLLEVFSIIFPQREDSRLIVYGTQYKYLKNVNTTERKEWK